VAGVNRARLGRARAAVITAVVAVFALALSGPSSATPAASNPLANIRWGNYSGPADDAYNAYRAATGTTKTLLGKIALRPRMRWFGAWIPNDKIHQKLSDYIANVTQGHPGALVQMAIFRLVPTESQARTRLPTSAEQASYKQWIDRAAATIGSTHVAMDLQPDLPVWTHEPNGSHVALDLVNYAAQKFAALPHTSVYINAGAADWLTVAQAVSMLRRAGVRYVRGFTLDDTHYDSNVHQIEYGAKIVSALSAAGIRGKHFVVNSAQNGKPFTFSEYHGSDYDNAAVCASKTSARCVTLGVPPTTDVTNTKWHLTSDARTKAGKYLDAFLWIGRPWLKDQSSPWVQSRALQLARTTPF
jgi:hypothetical protein